MKDDLRYTPSDCFKTFPFSEHFETDAALEAAGKAYDEFRGDLMVRSNEGLTATYNRPTKTPRPRPMAVLTMATKPPNPLLRNPWYARSSPMIRNLDRQPAAARV